MFLAAVLDAFPELAEPTFDAMRAAGLPGGWRIDLVDHADGVLRGKQLKITASADAPRAPAGRFRALEEHLLEVPLAGPVRERALAILCLLAEAEAAVHGVSLDDVHFHELADWDSIADVVGAAQVIDALGEVSWSVAPLPVGQGRVRSQHGPLPVPAPATARLLDGFAVIDDGIAGERVTPTGAAILRHLAPAARVADGAWTIAAAGYGFGTKRLFGISNVLRALVYEAADHGRRDERVAVIGFEVDDQTPEDLAIGLDTLRAADGVLDVVQMPAFAKKGRVCAHVQVLARPERLDAIVDRCFAETTTIGLRWRIEARAALQREAVRVGDDAVKVVTRPDDERTAKTESARLRGVAGHAARMRRRRRAEARALGEENDDG